MYNGGIKVAEYVSSIERLLRPYIHFTAVTGPFSLAVLLLLVTIVPLELLTPLSKRLILMKDPRGSSWALSVVAMSLSYTLLTKYRRKKVQVTERQQQQTVNNTMAYCSFAGNSWESLERWEIWGLYSHY